VLSDIAADNGYYSKVNAAAKAGAVNGINAGWLPNYANGIRRLVRMPARLIKGRTVRKRPTAVHFMAACNKLVVSGR
jgi:hypothetical protein